MRKIQPVTRGNGFRVEFDEARIDAVFKQFDQCQLPGAAVGIAIAGAPVYRKGFGLASMELPVLLSPAIRMRIGSTSKQFACLAYMLLCEEGKAGVDDPIGKYLPELPPVARRVTTRQLMTNVSGLRDVFDFAFQFDGTAQKISSAELFSMYLDVEDANATPGTHWIYNNGGFLLLSIAVERIAGQSLEEVLRTRIFDPMGMYATLLRRSETGFVSNCATLHTKNPLGDDLYERSPYYGTEFAGEGGIVSTVDDMLRWLAHMDHPVVGSAQTWRAMTSPQKLVNGSSSGYGFGLFIDRYRGTETLNHPGGGMGGNAQIVKVPEVRLDLVVLVNRDDSAVPLCNEVLDACIEGLSPLKDPFTGPFCAGTFHSTATGTAVQLFASNGRQLASINGMDMEIELDDEGILWPTGPWGYLKYAMSLVGDRQNPSSIRVSDFGNSDELLRLEPANEVNAGPILGRYCSKTSGTEVMVTNSDAGPQLITTGRYGSLTYSLECLADGIWRARPKWLSPRTGGVLVFDRARDGFRFSSCRTWGLHFRREPSK